MRRLLLELTLSPRPVYFCKCRTNSQCFKRHKSINVPKCVAVLVFRVQRRIFLSLSHPRFVHRSFATGIVIACGERVGGDASKDVLFLRDDPGVNSGVIHILRSIHNVPIQARRVSPRCLRRVSHRIWCTEWLAVIQVTALLEILVFPVSF